MTDTSTEQVSIRVLEPIERRAHDAGRQTLAHPSGESTIQLAVMATVLCSIFAHGLSALPGMEIYARRFRTLRGDAPELQSPDSA